ncbi:hypothetical protein Vadar_015605 [Vaccinium darrowii]|uniref:Uncharacterized protein n=1 Tax=Vaccinium darrowii TaxID=229202 RepID=A0ACB7X184_9ERIC|nr:hypothetical protein Vadar_015605 [Vaccinium darrowii]
MYATRPLSQYQRSPESLSLPPEGPNSGYLVIQDYETETTCCFGFCRSIPYLTDLPFPQNKDLTVKYSSGVGENKSDYSDDAIFIPVLNQPLSSNRYYVIEPHGSHKGEAYASSTEEDMTPCCFSKRLKRLNDVPPRPLNPNDMYNQFEISRTTASSSGLFTAKSVTPDGFPPNFLSRRGWKISATTPRTYELGEALGVNTALRARLPDFDSPLVVGKWYCPFMFVKDGNLGDQMKRSLFYEVTLERRWEKIFSCENAFSTQGNSVSVETEVQREVVVVGGREVVWDENRADDGVVWFRGVGGGEEVNIGLSSLVVDRMKWEAERGGWAVGGKRKVMVNRTEEFGGTGAGWSKFCCYVLVERFVLKRMDGSLALIYDFKHTDEIRSKWE